MRKALLGLLLLLLILPFGIINSQDTSTVEMTGVIVFIGDTTIDLDDGRTINLGALTLPDGITVGSMVTIVGIQVGEVIVAQSIEEADDDTEDEIEITAAVIAINGTTITLEGNILVEIGAIELPDDIEVGTVVVVIGMRVGDIIIAQEVEEADDDDDDQDEDLDEIIVIEGPVESININIISIYGIQIEVEPTNPLLTVIEIGDEIRVEGEVAESNGLTIIIVAINIIIIDADVDILVDEDGVIIQVFRFDGNCQNPPPDWAPANGWRRKCEISSSGGGGGGSNRGSNKGSGKKSS